MKKGLIIVFALLALGLVCLFIGMVSSGFNFDKMTGANYISDSKEVEEDFDSIKIDVDVADITFYKSTDGKIKVDTFGRETSRFEIEVKDSTLIINQIDESKFFDHIRIYSKSETVKVYLTGEYFEVLDVKCDTGDVNVPSDFSFKNVKIETHTGDTSLKCKVDEILYAEASTGHITLEKTDASSIYVKVTTGKVILKDINVNEKITILVSTGKSFLENVTCLSLETEGSTGDVTLTNVVASEVMTIKRSTGDVKFESSDAGEIQVSTSTGDVTGTFKTSKIFIIDASKADVPESTTGERCEIKTSTGKVKIRFE